MRLCSRSSAVLHIQARQKPARHPYIPQPHFPILPSTGKQPFVPWTPCDRHRPRTLVSHQRVRRSSRSQIQQPNYRTLERNRDKRMERPLRHGRGPHRALELERKRRLHRGGVPRLDGAVEGSRDEEACVRGVEEGGGNGEGVVAGGGGRRGGVGEVVEGDGAGGAGGEETGK